MNKETGGEKQEGVLPEPLNGGTPQEEITLEGLEQGGRTRSGRIRARNPAFRRMLSLLETAASEDAHGRTPRTPIKRRERRTGRGASRDRRGEDGD